MTSSRPETKMTLTLNAPIIAQNEHVIDDFLANALAKISICFAETSADICIISAAFLNVVDVAEAPQRRAAIGHVRPVTSARAE